MTVRVHRETPSLQRSPRQRGRTTSSSPAIHEEPPLHGPVETRRMARPEGSAARSATPFLFHLSTGFIALGAHCIAKNPEYGMRSSMMIKKSSNTVESYVIGAEASRILLNVRGVTDVCIESQYIDRVTLSYEWDGGVSKFDTRPDFAEIDTKLQAIGLHRMQ